MEHILHGHNVIAVVIAVVVANATADPVDEFVAFDDVDEDDDNDSG